MKEIEVDPNGSNIDESNLSSRGSMTTEGKEDSYKHKRHPATKERRTVARLAAGDCFGERALILEQPRSATCIARAPGGTICLVIKGGDFADTIASQANDIVWTDDIEALSIARYAAEYASHLGGVHETHKFESTTHKAPSLDPHERNIDWLDYEDPIPTADEWLKKDYNRSDTYVSKAREALHRKCLSKISHEVDPFDIISMFLRTLLRNLELTQP